MNSIFKIISLLLFFLYLQVSSYSQSTSNITILRGPYLQSATTTSIIIKWQTRQTIATKIWYGIHPDKLTDSVSVKTPSTDHEIKITGLKPSTVYYYTIGHEGEKLIRTSADMYFKTSPAYGTPGTYHFWAIGDAGMGNHNQQAVRDGFIKYNNSKHIDGCILLGDNAYGDGYNDGTQKCYQKAMFENMYESILKNSVVWPAAGNHDYNNHIPFSPKPAYYSIFTLPINGEAGGVPSGTEKYYSYNYGNIHFIVLESYDVSRSETGTMAEWLKKDLANDTLTWTIAYWHHPPYSKGAHDSDKRVMNKAMVEMRENILPIIEAGGVDLVLCGHSHSYERSFLLDGYYGYSKELKPSMIIDSAGGCYPSMPPYQKSTNKNKSHQGTVYAVVGCSGKLSGISKGWPHKAMYKAINNQLGSMVLDINKNLLTASFILEDGSVYDTFSIKKN